MDTTMVCPSQEALARIGTDDCSGSCPPGVATHIENCPECREFLKRRIRVGLESVTSRAAELPELDVVPRIEGFTIERELGRGSRGVVYLAHRDAPRRQVALKILPGGRRAGPRERRQWLCEAEAASLVRHPNVVALYEVAEADEWFLIVLEYIPGGTLAERLSEPLDPRIGAQLMETIARAVNHIHSYGLLHLDLKPSNILLDGDAEAGLDALTPKVSDFGVARRAEAGATDTGGAGPGGTPSYMAPEQITGARKDMTASADIHGLGAILYHLLTGRPPYQGATVIDTIDLVRRQYPIAPRRLNPRVPSDLETICLKCLEKDPSRRYASAELLASDLERWLKGRSISARPVSPSGYAVRWCRREPVKAALAAALLLTVIGGFCGLLALLKRSEIQRSRSEANYQVASESLVALVKVLSENRIASRFDSRWPARHIESLKIAHLQFAELSKQSPLDLNGLKRLATIEGDLAMSYGASGKLVEAMSLVEDHIQHLERSRALDPDDSQSGYKSFGAALGVLTNLIGSRKDNLFQQWNARLMDILGRWDASELTHAEAVSKLSHQHRRHANYLLLREDPDGATKELEEDFVLLRSLPVTERGFPELVLSEALTLAALGKWLGRFGPVRSEIDMPPVSRDARESFEYILAELTARRIGWLSSVVKSTLVLPAKRSANEWSDSVISSIKSDSALFGWSESYVPKIAWTTRHYCLTALGWYRKSGRLSEATRTADQLLALAERLVGAYPEQATPLLLLSEGYIQKEKNSIRENEDNAAVIEQWRRKALDALIRASTIEPDNDEVHGRIKDRLARMERLALQRK
jgi:eukaryotic-like serine/threonine-protein kinase